MSYRFYKAGEGPKGGRSAFPQGGGVPDFIRKDPGKYDVKWWTTGGAGGGNYWATYALKEPEAAKPAPSSSSSSGGHHAPTATPFSNLPQFPRMPSPPKPVTMPVPDDARIRADQERRLALRKGGRVATILSMGNQLV